MFTPESPLRRGRASLRFTKVACFFFVGNMAHSVLYPWLVSLTDNRLTVPFGPPADPDMPNMRVTRVCLFQCQTLFSPTHAGPFFPPPTVNPTFSNRPHRLHRLQFTFFLRQCYKAHPRIILSCSVPSGPSRFLSSRVLWSPLGTCPPRFRLPFASCALPFPMRSPPDPYCRRWLNVPLPEFFTAPPSVFGPPVFFFPWSGTCPDAL